MTEIVERSSSDELLYSQQTHQLVAQILTTKTTMADKFLICGKLDTFLKNRLLDNIEHIAKCRRVNWACLPIAGVSYTPTTLIGGEAAIEIWWPDGCMDDGFPEVTFVHLFDAQSEEFWSKRFASQSFEDAQNRAIHPNITSPR